METTFIEKGTRQEQDRNEIDNLRKGMTNALPCKELISEKVEQNENHTLRTFLHESKEYFW